MATDLPMQHMVANQKGPMRLCHWAFYSDGAAHLKGMVKFWYKSA